MERYFLESIRDVNSFVVSGWPLRRAILITVKGALVTFYLELSPPLSCFVHLQRFLSHQALGRSFLLCDFAPTRVSCAH